MGGCPPGKAPSLSAVSEQLQLHQPCRGFLGNSTSFEGNPTFPLQLAHAEPQPLLPTFAGLELPLGFIQGVEGRFGSTFPEQGATDLVAVLALDVRSGWWW